MFAFVTESGNRSGALIAEMLRRAVTALRNGDRPGWYDISDVDRTVETLEDLIVRCEAMDSVGLDAATRDTTSNPVWPLGPGDFHLAAAMLDWQRPPRDGDDPRESKLSEVADRFAARFRDLGELRARGLAS